MLGEELKRQDETLAARGLTIWIGAEPTFTRADALDPPWLGNAEGGDKEERARALLGELASRLARGGQVSRVLGRHFPEEPKPRFAYGLRWLRSGETPHGGTLDGDPAPAPPHDREHAWLTVTPDPGVVEVNLAPAPDLATFASWAERTYEAAAAVGLSPRRFRWNGDVSDSGGGGQLTFGGPTPAESPFFAKPWLLPGLVRYLNRHPSLSYWFAPECVGSAGQGPRADEGDPERFHELALALDVLASRGGDIGPAELWQTLAPLLCDGAGNSHRAEVNVEKLANPQIPGRGELGVVELRALRMEPDARRMAAVAALYRAILARLAPEPYREPLVDWGAALHDRFALPHFLAADLDTVLADLDAAGVGLGPETTALLRAAPEPLCRLELGGQTLTVRPAREFWPLVGDVASQERRGARWVDASTARVEIETSGGTVSAAGHPVGAPVCGVRWRTFAPSPGLHPVVRALDPLPLRWVVGDEALAISIHGWRPDGGAYPSLPDEAEAARRRAERIVVTRTEPGPQRRAETPPYTLDLRRGGVA